MKARMLLTMLFLPLIIGCVQPTPQPTDANTPGTPNMPNPASAYCEQQGYKLEIRTSDGSQSGVCIFPDGRECDEWAYYRKECAPATQDAFLPNPASVFCEQQGYKVKIRIALDGSQNGACVFSDGSECDEWAFFRGECKPFPTETPTAKTEVDSQAWETYANEGLGYSFDYPAGAQITTNDEPLKSLFISGLGMGDETWGIAHPSDREEYRPPKGADLLQWLSDHYLLGEKRLADEQIAGTTAVHFRHEASPQSYAFDQYYFAHIGQLYQITIGHGSDAEDWELNNRFLKSFQFIEPTSDSPASAALPTVLPIDPSVFQDWGTYTNSEYGFSLRLPDGWVAEEVTLSDPLLVDHEVNIHSIIDTPPTNIRLTFRQSGEETPLWPSGVGQGEFIQKGSLDLAGQPAVRLLLVCPTGEVTAIWYHQSQEQPNITLGDLEFGIIFSTPGHCEGGNNLGGESQLVGELIIASLTVP
jgi:putative hemolysin